MPRGQQLHHAPLAASVLGSNWTDGVLAGPVTYTSVGSPPFSCRIEWAFSLARGAATAAGSRSSSRCQGQGSAPRLWSACGRGHLRAELSAVVGGPWLASEDGPVLVVICLLPSLVEQSHLRSQRPQLCPMAWVKGVDAPSSGCFLSSYGLGSGSGSCVGSTLDVAFPTSLPRAGHTRDNC